MVGGGDEWCRRLVVVVVLVGDEWCRRAIVTNGSVGGWWLVVVASVGKCDAW